MKSQLTVTLNAASKSAEIMIYGPIGGSFWSDDGITAKQFIEALNEIESGTDITIRVNSQGGAIGEGLAIYNAIARRKAEITARIDGYALSAGSFIPLAAGKVISPKSSIWMIHKGWMYAAGNADEMRKAAETLDKHDETLIGIYEDKTGKTRKEIADALAEETWFTGEEAIDWGLADEDGGEADAAAMAELDLLSRPRAFAHPERLKEILAGHSSSQVSHGKDAPAEKPAKDLQTTGTVLAAARTKPKEKESDMETKEKPAQAATEQPAQDTGTDTKLDKLVTVVDKLANTVTGLVDGQEGSPAPLGTGRVQNLGNPLIRAFDEKIGLHDKATFARANYRELREQKLIAAGVKDKDMDPFNYKDPKVMAANTVDAALANTILSDEFVTTMRTYIAPWMAFTRGISPSPVSKRQTIEVPLVSSAGSMLTNPTNYESGDSTEAPIAVTVSEYSKSFHTSRPEQNLGLQLAALVPTNVAVLAEGIHALITALMTNANYGADNVIGLAANFDSADLPAILALGKNFNRVTLLLDGGHLAYLLPTSRESFAFGEPGAYGFDGGIYKNNLWTSAASDIAGFVCGPDAIVTAFGLPEQLPSGEFMSVMNIDVNGIPFQSSVWFSRATRAVWGNVATMAGVQKGDTTQGKVLTTA